MTSRYLLCLVLVFVSGCQSTLQCSTTRLSLWSIESPTAKVYLMGSVHALSERDYPLPREFEDAFRESGTLVVEVNLNAVPQDEMYRLMYELGHYQEGDIRSQVSADTLVSLENYLLSTRQQLADYLKMKPWLVSLQITAQRLHLAGYDPHLGVDQYFLDRAGGNLDILELESVEQQLGMLAHEPPELQDKLLLASLRSMDSLESELESLVASWSKGDADGMYGIAMGSVSDDPALTLLLSRLLDERNRKMAEKISGYLEGPGTYLVIVGALHMGGEAGLISLLGKQYPTRQIERCANG